VNARARYVLLTGVRWLPVGLLAPVTVRFMLSRDLDLATVGAVLVVYGATVIALEIPTGGLADTVGTRRVLAIGSVLALVMYVALLLAHHWIVFVAIALVHGMERALKSGPLEAWYVSDEVARGRSERITRGLSLGMVAEALALGSGALLAGLLPLLLPWGGVLTLPIAVALGCEVVHLALVLALVPARVARTTEPPTTRAVVAGTVRFASGRRDLRRLLLASGAIGCGLASVELLWQPRVTSFLTAPDDDPWVFGVFAACAFFFAAGGAMLSARLSADATRHAHVATVGTITYGACFLGLAVAGGVWPFGLAFGASYLAQSATGPWQRTLLHVRTPSESRATMLSVDSLGLMAGGLLSDATLPRIAEATSIPTAWVLAGTIVALSAACYRGLDRDVPLVSPRAAGTA
jgi:MFS family permease